MRFLGVDYGSRNIGVAVSDELGIGARGVTTLRDLPADEAIDRIADLAEQLSVAAVVVGVPLGAAGEVGDAARAGSARPSAREARLRGYRRHDRHGISTRREGFRSRAFRQRLCQASSRRATQRDLQGRDGAHPRDAGWVEEVGFSAGIVRTVRRRQRSDTLRA